MLCMFFLSRNLNTHNFMTTYLFCISGILVTLWLSQTRTLFSNLNEKHILKFTMNHHFVGYRYQNEEYNQFRISKEIPIIVSFTPFANFDITKVCDCALLVKFKIKALKKECVRVLLKYIYLVCMVFIIMYLDGNQATHAYGTGMHASAKRSVVHRPNNHNA